MNLHLTRTRWMLVLIAALTLILFRAPPTDGSTQTSTSLKRVAFVSVMRGVGLFETATGASPGHCVVYTRQTSSGGASFGAEGAPLERGRCGNGEDFSQLAFSGTGLLLAYGPRLKVSRDVGLTWATPTIPGSVVAVSMLGRAAWALVTRCHIGRLTCRLTLLASDDGGATWSVQAAQPPDPVVSGAAAFSAELGQSSLLAVAPTGALVMALPVPISTTSKPTPAIATVEQLGPGGQKWITNRVPCAAFEQSELSIAPDGAEWLACASEPGAGSQIKSLAVSSDGGAIWKASSEPCIPSRHCRNTMPIGGYLDALVALSSRIAFYGGYRSSLAGTVDGGRTWHLWQRVGGQDTGTTQVTFVNPRDGWALAEDSYYTSSTVWHTVNGGRSWSRP